MAQMNCKCGIRLSNTLCPNEMEGELSPLYGFDKRNVWECFECGRLYIDIDDPKVKGCHISKSYIPENGEVGNLFSIGSSEDFFKYLSDFWKFNEKALRDLSIIQDKETILNEIIRDYQRQLQELRDQLMEKDSNSIAQLNKDLEKEI